MEAIVYGFPSKLAALQFEWAWQSPWLSRHLKVKPVLHSEETQDAKGKGKRKAIPTVNYFNNAKSGHNHPQMKIAVLQRMLVTSPWNTMDLAVTLFSRAASTWWQDALIHGGENPKVYKRTPTKVAQKIMDPALSLPDVSDIQLSHRYEGVDGSRLLRENPALHATTLPQTPIDIDDWAFVERHWQKWLTLKDSDLTCSCCRKPIDSSVRLCI